jgi:predicted metalloprotease with PDZ domain
MRPRQALACALAALSAGCAAPPPPPPPPPDVARPAPWRPSEPWRYRVLADGDGSSLRVEATIFAPAGGELTLEDGGAFATEMEVATTPRLPGSPPYVRMSRFHKDGQLVFTLPPCPREGCRVRYQIALARAARETGRIACAQEVRGAFLTSPSAWLLHPVEIEHGQRFEVSLVSSPPTTFVSGLLPKDGAIALPPETYAADVSDLGNPAWAAVGELRMLRVDVGGQTIDVAVAPGEMIASDDDLRAWIEGAARAVQGYYGMRPIQRALVVVVPTGGRGMHFGRALGNGGATIVAMVGDRSTLADLTSGWELIHELLHTAFPKMVRDHAWLEEGMATYVEPLLRARLGMITPEDAFARLSSRMRYGLPEADDQGLDRTHTWGRTYWGGALFCLLADVEIRTRTRGKRSLDDALRAILAAGGNVSERWEIDRVMAVGDEATGTSVLRDLYARMGSSSAPVDLDALWKKLGVVSAKGDSVKLDDKAELAWVRRAMVKQSIMVAR